MERCLFKQAGSCSAGWPCKLEKGHHGGHVEWDSCQTILPDEYDPEHGEPDKCHLMLGHDGKCGYGAGPRGPRGIRGTIGE